MFIKAIFKESTKVKSIKNNVSKLSLYPCFLIQQNLVIFGEKMLISAELKGCATWFIYFLVLLWVRYNCAKFIIAGYVWQILGRGTFFAPPPLPLILEQPQGDPPWIGLTEIWLKGAHLRSILLGLWSNRWRTPVKMLILWKIISWQFLWYCNIIVISYCGYIATVFEKCHSRFEKRQRFSFRVIHFTLPLCNLNSHETKTLPRITWVFELQDIWDFWSYFSWNDSCGKGKLHLIFDKLHYNS